MLHYHDVLVPHAIFFIFLLDAIHLFSQAAASLLCLSFFPPVLDLIRFDGNKCKLAGKN
jgi:hypothetical protein